MNDIASALCQRLGFDALNEMQRQVLDISPLPRRLTLLAPTGTGKTAAFAIYLLRALKSPGNGLQAVVIGPSRELVTQTHSVLRQAMQGYKVTALYGGHPFQYERDALAVMPDVIVATPGRLLDHLQRQSLSVTPDSLGTLVIDEYDKLMEMGFQHELSRIVRRLGRVAHIVMASATAPAEMPGYMRSDKAVTLDFAASTASPSERMEMMMVTSPAPDKLDTLISLLRTLRGSKTIVFVNHRDAAERVYKALRGHGLAAALYHGGLDQQRRQTVLDMYANGSAPILVATDLAARGLDINDVGHIVHYHLPVDAEAWTHRNGRTARQHASGAVYVILNEHERSEPPSYLHVDTLKPWAPSEKTSAETVEPPYTSFYIDGGRRQGVSRGDILGALTKVLGLPGTGIGRIALHDAYAVVALAPEAASMLPKTDAPVDVKVKGRRLRITPLAL